MVDLGVLPTPGVAHVSAVDGVAAAMISASHNPFADNGIKVFAAGGRKLSDEVEEQLEEELAALGAQGGSSASSSRCRRRRGAHRPRRGGPLRRPPGVRRAARRRLDGVRLVIDTANGAVSACAADVFAALGAEVSAINTEPDGVNINEGVRLHPSWRHPGRGGGH